MSRGAEETLGPIPEIWRYLDSGPLTGAENMALDQAIFEAHREGLVPPTLRVYGWHPPAVSLGRFQRAETAVDLAACAARGLEVVRRPTGGRAILHTAEEVTFSLIISAARLGTTGVMDSYRSLASGIVAALRLLGLDARLVERASPPARSPIPAATLRSGDAPSLRSTSSRFPAADPACFAVKARCDLVVGRAKLVGSAQVQRHGFLLQQNSLPLRLRTEEWSQVFLRAARPPEALGLWEVAGREIPAAEVADALRRGFASALGLTFEDGRPTEAERRRAAACLPEVRVA